MVKEFRALILKTVFAAMVSIPATAAEFAESMEEKEPRSHNEASFQAVPEKQDPQKNNVLFRMLTCGHYIPGHLGKEIFKLIELNKAICNEVNLGQVFQDFWKNKVIWIVPGHNEMERFARSPANKYNIKFSKITPKLHEIFSCFRETETDHSEVISIDFNGVLKGPNSPKHVVNMHLPALERFPNLERVNLRDTSTENISWAAKVPKLKILSLSRTFVTDISALAASKNLTELNLSLLCLRDISALIALENLEKIDLSYIFAKDMSPLVHLPKLHTLRMSETMDDKRILASLQNLTNLNLSHNKSFGNMSLLVHMLHLRILNLSKTNTQRVAPLLGLHELEELYLQEAPVEDGTELRHLPKLRILDMSNNKLFKDVDAVELAGSQSIEDLNLSDTGVGDLASLTNMSRLCTLRLIDKVVRDLPVLASSKSLRVVYISSREIDVSALERASIKICYN